MTRIRVKRGGPLKVEGDFKIIGKDGEEIDLSGRSAVLLCRCGQSKRAPFCDGAHNRVRFDVDEPLEPSDD